MVPELKAISCQGGLVTFRIPAHWKEEYGPQGGGTFYENAVDSSTFRLEVITAKPPQPVTTESGQEILMALCRVAPGDIERLPSGCALVRYAQSAMDRGQPLFITYWSVVHIIPPDHIRIATFSHTLRDLQRHISRFQEELALLDREVRACAFAPETGSTLC